MIYRSIRRRCLSEGAHYVEIVVVDVFPEGRVAEIGVIHELPTTLGPSDRLRLGVSVDDCRVYYINNQVRDIFEIYSLDTYKERNSV